MLSGLAIVLGLTAAAAGATGTWSPCGFSMVDSLGATGPWGRRGSIAACATFTAGALVGGAATFAGLSALGALLHTAGHAGAAVAAAIALAAAVGEARGVRVVPQIRRQVPESWRRIMPLPVAGALYGVLLGMGFTTFVLTFAVWALAAICLILGDVHLGLAVGLGFGLGRALPVAVLAPLADRELGIRAVETMAERPATLRGLRLGDAVAMAACALAIGATRVEAAVPVASPATDPTVGAGAVGWMVPGQGYALRTGGGTFRAPGDDMALGGSLVAVRSGSLVTVVRAATGQVLLQLSVPGADKLAISDSWLVYRRRGAGGDVMAARSLRAPGRERVLAAARAPAQLGRPAIRGNAVVFHIARRSTSIVLFDLRTHHRRTLRHSFDSQVLNPSIQGTRFLYVEIGRCSQELWLANLSGRGSRVLMRLGGPGRRDSGHDPGHTTQGSGPSHCPGGSPRHSSVVLWTTALSRRVAYVTRLVPLADGSTRPSIVRVAA